MGVDAEGRKYLTMMILEAMMTTFVGYPVPRGTGQLLTVLTESLTRVALTTWDYPEAATPSRVACIRPILGTADGASCAPWNGRLKARYGPQDAPIGWIRQRSRRTT